MALVRSFLRPTVTPEAVKSEVTERLEGQRQRLEHLRPETVREGYRAVGDRLERRRVPRP